MPEATPTPARTAYEAYAASTGGLTHDGRQMPHWDHLGDKIRRAWAVAALAVQLNGNPMPQTAYGDAWAELTSYVQDAADCGEPIDAEHLAAYMGELKRRALAPVREWMRGITEQAPPTGN